METLFISENFLQLYFIHTVKYCVGDIGKSLFYNIKLKKQTIRLTSAQDRITWSGFTFLHKTTKIPNKIYETVTLKLQDSRQWKLMISERGETNEVSPYAFPSLLPGESFRAMA